MDNPVPPGIYEVEFMNRRVRIVNLKQLIENTQGFAVYLEVDDGTLYNFSNILSLRKLKLNTGERHA